MRYYMYEVVADNGYIIADGIIEADSKDQAVDIFAKYHHYPKYIADKIKNDFFDTSINGTRFYFASVHDDEILRS